MSWGSSTQRCQNRKIYKNFQTLIYAELRADLSEIEDLSRSQLWSEQIVYTLNNWTSNLKPLKFSEISLYIWDEHVCINLACQGLMVNLITDLEFDWNIFDIFEITVNSLKWWISFIWGPLINSDWLISHIINFITPLGFWGFGVLSLWFWSCLMYILKNSKKMVDVCASYKY